jgi:uncharacterized protein (DUF2237 family)
MVGILFLILCGWVFLLNPTNISGRENFANKDTNVVGSPLSPCSTASSGKVTGYYRDGFCRTDSTDSGTHVVCSVVDDAFLQFTKEHGNDLSTPHPPSFPGLVQGDRWCLCALRWMEAYKAGKAPKIVLESTKDTALRYIPKDVLMGS